jgi:hypothetical protein
LTYRPSIPGKAEDVLPIARDMGKPPKVERVSGVFVRKEEEVSKKPGESRAAG